MLAENVYSSFHSLRTDLRKKLIPVICALPVSLQAAVTGPVDIHHLYKPSEQSDPVYMHIHLPNGLAEDSPVLPTNKANKESLTGQLDRLSDDERLLSVNYDEWLPEFMPLSLELCLRNRATYDNTIITLPLDQEPGTTWPLQVLPGTIDSQCSQVRLGHNAEPFASGQDDTEDHSVADRAYNLLMVELSKKRHGEDDVLPLDSGNPAQPSLASLLSGGAFGGGLDDPFNKKKPAPFFSGNPSEDLQLWAWSSEAFLTNPEYDQEGSAMPSTLNDIVIETLYPDGHGTVRTYHPTEWMAMVQKSCGLDDDTVDDLVSWHRGAHITLHIKNPEHLAQWPDAGQDGEVLPYGGMISCMWGSQRGAGASGYSGQASGRSRGSHKPASRGHRLQPLGSGAGGGGGDRPQGQPNFCPQCGVPLKEPLETHQAKVHPETLDFVTARAGEEEMVSASESDSDESDSDESDSSGDDFLANLASRRVPGISRASRRPAAVLSADTSSSVLQATTAKQLGNVISQLNSFTDLELAALFNSLSEHIVLEEYGLSLSQYLELTSTTGTQTVITLRDRIMGSLDQSQHPQLQANKIVLTALARTLAASFSRCNITIPRDLQNADMGRRQRYEDRELLPIVQNLVSLPGGLGSLDVLRAELSNPPADLVLKIATYVTKTLTPKASTDKDYRSAVRQGLATFSQKVDQLGGNSRLSELYSAWQLAGLDPELLMTTLMSRGFELQLTTGGMYPETSVRAAIMQQLAGFWDNAGSKDRLSYAGLALDLMKENFLSHTQPVMAAATPSRSVPQAASGFVFTGEMIRVLDRDDHLSVVTELVDLVAAEWHRLALSLGMRQSVIDRIKRDNRGDCEDCLGEVITEWLRQNIEGPLPSWKVLIEAVQKRDKAAAIALYNSINKPAPLTHTTPLDINNLDLVLEIVRPVTSKIHGVSLSLGISSDAYAAIEKQYRNLEDIAREVMTRWLKQNIRADWHRRNGQRFNLPAQPTIKTLAWAMSLPIGGQNPAAAINIMKKYGYKGDFLQLGWRR